VLELAAGGGLHIMTLIGTGAEVTVTDISAESLSLLRERFRRVKGNLKAQIADIEAFPFSGSTFDVVTCAGSLSYGDNTIVMNEVFRVLKPGGIFICVDSLNNNPVYRFNRWLYYLRGNRTKSTLLRMPTMQLIDSYRRRFGYVEAHFFGSLIWCIPLFVLLFGQFKSSMILDRLDRIINVRASAFKFVMVARKY
jgi:ubiquinone/menaquinone biosynthesis C-methylase UbiE